MIQEILMKNVKGTSVNQELTGKDIILGPNGIGKSTRLQALGTALLGYVPGAGKTPAETFKLSSDSEAMSVGLKTDTFSFQREFNRSERRKQSTGETEIKYSEAVSISPSKGERTNTQKKNRIEQEVGSFPVMLDFDQFLSLSDNKRRDFIYSLSNTESNWTQERLQQHLEDELLSMELEVDNPDYYDVMKEAIQEALNQFPSHFEFADGLNAVIDWVTDQLKYWRKSKKDSEGAVRSFAEMKNKMNETDRNAKKNKEELVELRNKLTTIKEQLARDTEKKKAFEKKQDRLEELQKTIEQLENDPVQSTESLEKEIAELNQQMKEVPESKAGDYEAKAQELEKQKEQLLQESWKAKAKYQEFQTKKAAIQQNVDTINENKGICVIHKQIACNKDFSAYLEHATKQTAGIQAEMDQLETLGLENQNKAEEVARQAQEWRKKAQEDNNQFREVVNFNQRLTTKIQSIKEQINVVTKRNEQRETKLTDLKEEFQKLKNEPNEAIAPLDVLERQRDEIAKQISELETKVEEQEKVKNQLMTLKTSMLSNKKAEMNAEAYAAIQKSLGSQGVQGLIMKEQLEPIKKDIETNLKAMGIDHEVYFQTESDTGQEVFQFGWIANNVARNFNSLSTGQQIMYLIAFMVTILERANPAMKIIAIDNIENLDKKNFTNVLNGLNQLSDKLDNIILSGVIDPVEVEGWKVWDLSEQVGELHESA